MNTHYARTFTLLFLAVIMPANADTWEQRFPNGTPPAARASHTTVWTGSEMIVWGGHTNGSGHLNDGGSYNPAGNSWTAVSPTGAPSARAGHSAVWTGSEMIVWGGIGGGVNFNSGARYNPVANSWTAVSTTGAPTPRNSHTAVWTGSEMLVWGGVGAPSGGGAGAVALNTGGRYNPAANSWTAVTTTDAPAARSGNAAVWTGSEMIVWGGEGGGVLGYWNTGGRYNPAGNSWTAVTTTGAPAARTVRAAVWTGSEMIVWGGFGGSSLLSDGGRYNPAGDSWTAVTAADAPAARNGHTAVWTGSEMIVWGGFDVVNYSNTGGRYNPAGDSWTAVSPTGAPAARSGHTSMWTGSEMIVWGGSYNDGIDHYFNDIFTYTPDARDGDAFRITSAVLEGGNLVLAFPSVTGRNYTLWQSDTLAEGTWTNTGLPALPGTGASLTFSVPAPTPNRQFYRVQANP